MASIEQMIIAAIRDIPEMYFDLPTIYKCNHHIAKATIETNNELFKDMPQAIKRDTTLAQLAVTLNPENYKYVIGDARNCTEILLEAINGNQINPGKSLIIDNMRFSSLDELVKYDPFYNYVKYKTTGKVMFGHEFNLRYPNIQLYTIKHNSHNYEVTRSKLSKFHVKIRVPDSAIIQFESSTKMTFDKVYYSFS